MDWDVSPTIVNSPGATFTLSITGRKGTPVDDDTPANSGIIVALIATDSYGKMAASDPFIVRVNHDPMAFGAQNAKADRKTLGNEDDYMNMLWDGVDRADGAAPDEATATNGVTEIPLVEAGSSNDGEEENGGYFSDGDGVADLISGDAGCSVVGKTGDSLRFNIVEDGTTGIDLLVIPKKLGPMSLTIECEDTFGKTARDTLNLNVRRQKASTLQ